MSESISPAVELRVRIGPYHDGRMKSRPIGSTVTCWVEAFAEGTSQILDVDGVMSAMVWLPEISDFSSQGQPAEPVRTGPGQWRVDVLGGMVGVYTLVPTLILDGSDPVTPALEAGQLQFEITSAGNLQPLPAGGVPYAVVQAAATAAAVSAGYASGRLSGAAAGADAGALAGVQAVQPLAERAETAADGASVSEIVALGAADISIEQAQAAEAARVLADQRAGDAEAARQDAAAKAEAAEQARLDAEAKAQAAGASQFAAETSASNALTDADRAKAQADRAAPEATAAANAVLASKADAAFTAFRPLAIKAEAFVEPEDFGNIVYVNAPYTTGNVTPATDATLLIRAAIARAVAQGLPVRLRSRVYKITDEIEFPATLHIEGTAAAEWAPGLTLPSGVSSPLMNGTILLYTGTPVTKRLVTGITDCRTAGGVVANPNSREPGYDDYFRLTSFYNEDADPVSGAAATRRPIACGVYVPPGATGVVARNFRVMPSHGGATGYLSGTKTLGAAFDVGIYIDNANRCVFENVDPVGYWRVAGMFARAGTCVNELDMGYGIERNEFSKCTFGGAVSALIRGPDTIRVTAVGSDWVEVPWAANHPFDPAIVNTIRRTSSPETYFRYTGVSVVTPDRLRLTGVSRLTSGADLSAGQSITLGHSSVGMGEFTLANCTLIGLGHTAGVRATSAQLGSSRQLKPSACIELSGWRVRGLRTPFCKFMSQDDVGHHIHAAGDVVFGPYTEWESKNADSLGLGMAMICSPDESSNDRVEFPAGQTFRLVIDCITTMTGVDFRPYGTNVPPRFPISGNLFRMNTGQFTSIYEPVDGGNFQRVSEIGKVGWRRQGGQDIFTYSTPDNLSTMHVPFRITANSRIEDANGNQLVGPTRLATVNSPTADAAALKIAVDSLIARLKAHGLIS